MKLQVVETGPSLGRTPPRPEKDVQVKGSVFRESVALGVESNFRKPDGLRYPQRVRALWHTTGAQP